MRLATLIFPLLLVAGCGDAASSYVDEGPRTSRSFPAGDFAAIDMRGAEKLVVRTGQPVSVKAEGSQRAIDALQISTQSGRLLIGRKQGEKGVGKGTTITVTVPKLDSMTVEGAGDIDVDRVSGDSFSLVLAGAGSFNLGAAQLKSIDMSLRGAGSVTAKGTADRARIETRGVGSYEIDGLVTQDLDVSVKGTGSVSANATRTAKIDLAGVGSVDVVGGAKCEISRKGVGSVTCK